MLRIKILAACCAAITACAVAGIVVGHATSPVVASAQDYPTATPTTAATPTSAAPSPRPGRTTVTDFAAIDSAYAALGKAIDDYKAGHPVPVPPPSPSPSPSPPPPPPAQGRFPGDPGPGKAIIGVASNLGAAGVAAREKDVGSPLAYREYDNNGISDLAVPNGPVAQQIRADHAAGRVPVISVKPGIEALAAHQYQAQLQAFFSWTEAQAKVTVIIAHHEPENDWPADFHNTAAMAKHAADYRAAQQWVRTNLNQAAGGKPKRTVFIGSLMTFSWTPQGIAQFGDPNQWNPGKQADGSHVWDACGGDHYEPGTTASSFDTPKWQAFVASVKSWGCVPAITELGVADGNPNGGKALAAFLPLAVERDGCPIVLYFDSTAGAGGKPQSNPADWWTLESGNGTLPAFTDFLHSHGSNPDA